jgi:hypothetical protein
MKLTLLALTGCVFAVGCSGADAGSEIPKAPPPPTAEQIQSMPPQARKAMEDAQKSGDFQSQRMAEMAAAQRAAAGGK